MQIYVSYFRHIFCCNIFFYSILFILRNINFNIHTFLILNIQIYVSYFRHILCCNIFPYGISIPFEISSPGSKVPTAHSYSNQECEVILLPKLSYSASLFPRGIPAVVGFSGWKLARGIILQNFFSLFFFVIIIFFPLLFFFFCPKGLFYCLNMGLMFFSI